VERLDADGLILGIKRGVNFEQQKTHLLPGDLLVLFTDGIVEAENRNDEFFGDERLCQLLENLAGESATDIIELVLQQTRMFTQIHSFNDDVSLVVMRILSTDEN